MGRRGVASSGGSRVVGAGDSVFVDVDIVTLFGLSVLRPEMGRQARLRLLHLALMSMTFMD
jgi:hypothetical protein